MSAEKRHIADLCAVCGSTGVVRVPTKKRSGKRGIIIIPRGVRCFCPVGSGEAAPPARGAVKQEVEEDV